MLGQEVEVVRNDILTASQVLKRNPKHLVIGPGPGWPSRAGICAELIQCAEIPILGICLGHQAIGQVFGARVIKAKEVMHGKTSCIHHEGVGLFRGLPPGFEATRYHSLVLEDLPSSLLKTAWTKDGMIMGIQHQIRPIYGVQFHPESVASIWGIEILKNFCVLN